MINCLLEANLMTSRIAYPLQRGWLDKPDWLSLHDRVGVEDVRRDPACGLIDAIDAVHLSESHVVMSDIALVSLHSGPIAMRTRTRPDEVEQAVVQLGSVGSTSEAVARATVHHFYGIDVVDWTRTGQETEAEIVEGADSLAEPPEDIHLEDLIRAWFILSSLALPTHVLVVPKDALASESDAVKRVVSTLQRSIDVAEERRRELRRNISEDEGIDREVLIDYYNDQKVRLTKSARKGWLDLSRRVAHPMGLPRDARPDVRSLS